MAKRPDHDLADHLRAAAAEKDDPWRKRRAALKRRTAGWEEEFNTNCGKAWDDLRENFGRAGYNSLLSEDQAQELATILEASPWQQYRRARALLQMSASERLSLHNFSVGEACGTNFLETWGPIIENLPVPLFPKSTTSRDHADTNLKLLAQMQESMISGAGPGRRPKLTVFARDVTTGAGYKAPVEDGAVDLGVVEVAIGGLTDNQRTLYARMDALEQQFNRNNNGRGGGKGKGRGRGNGGNQNGNHQSNNQYNGNQQHNNGNQQYSNNSNGMNYNGNGNYNQSQNGNGNYNNQSQNGNGNWNGRGNGTVRGRGEDIQPEYEEGNGYVGLNVLPR